MAYNYRQINFEVMSDTEHFYKTMPVLICAVENSIANQYMVSEEDNIDQHISDTKDTRYIVSGKRSFEAAKDYKGKKVAVLNYANNLSIGGAPFFAGAQEESLCRCSTLLPCLQAMKESFYQKHHHLYITNQMDFMGNDDLIYTQYVVIFKSDERTDTVHPRMMNHEEWFKVNVITCAAPQMQIAKAYPKNYESAIRARIKKILDVAAKENNEVVILGAWGCGAFKNPIEIVARTFIDLLKNYDFKIVEFALATRNDVQSSAFARALRNQ
jgi:uncharacterized protein (TIGR02452 family)